MAEKQQPEAKQDTGLPIKHKIAQLPNEFDYEEGRDADDPGLKLSPENQLHYVYYLVVDDEYEREASEHWMARYAPEVPYNNLINKLPLERLDHRSIIFLLQRKGTRRNPVKPALESKGRSPEGFFVHEKVDPRETAEGFGAYGPIRVADFWQKGANRFQGGLNKRALIAKIGEYAVPSVVRFMDAPTTRNDSRDGTTVWLSNV